MEGGTGRGGRETVDQAGNQNDDLINAALGAILLCAKPESGVVVASVTRATDGSYREGGHAAQSPGQSAPPWSYGDQGAIHPHSRIERAGPAQPPSRWRNIWGA